MSELFQRLQDHFRFIKEHHDVDLTVSHGVKLNGKIYPATHKLLTMGQVRNPADAAKSTESRFYIPLENGLKVHVSNYLGEMDKLYMQLHVPTIGLQRDGNKVYRYGIALHKGEDAYNASLSKNPNNNPSFEKQMSLHYTTGPISSAHEVLNMWGKEPYQGTYDYIDSGKDEFKKIRPHADVTWADTDDLELTEDELNEHHQNVKLHPSDAPHNVTVYGVDTDHAFYNYNTKTEQLRPYREVFPWKSFPNKEE